MVKMQQFLAHQQGQLILTQQREKDNEFRDKRNLHYQQKGHHFLSLNPW
jgi:hypothetical protein